MNADQAKAHHYVPQWYQKRFLKIGQSNYYYLDLSPDTIKIATGGSYQRRALLYWGPGRCFYSDHLYTVRVGSWTSDDLERRFFGKIDSLGREAVEVFGAYSGFNHAVHVSIPKLITYMDAQRFRTPTGLRRLKALIGIADNNTTLMLMQRLFRVHTTMWSEGVWEVLSAKNSPTKFIVTDDPVSFFNRRIFPKEVGLRDIELDKVGTRTIFPLDSQACLVITHTQFVRNPWINPVAPRTNARVFQPTLKMTMDTQYGRELSENEVLRINYLIKRRASRYIAAAEREWLFPEDHLDITEWSKADADWFLLPNPYKVAFTREIVVGYKDGSSWAVDEYGRHPADPKYRDEIQHNREWESHLSARKAWAERRRGKPLARVDNTMREDEVADEMMARDLDEQECPETLGES